MPYKYSKWHNQPHPSFLLFFFSSLFFSCLTIHSVLTYIGKWRWKKCRDLNPPLFSVSSQNRVGSNSSLKSGGSVWPLPAVMQMRAFVSLWWLPPNFQLFLELRRSWKVESCRKDCNKNRISSPSFCSICILEISSQVLRGFWEIQLLTHTQLLNYLRSMCQF